MSARALHFALVAALGFAAAAPAAERIELAWPTPHPAWAEGKSPTEFLQHAGSGDPTSGAFGGVRDGGARFHEGIDIRAFARDRRGEPTDSVFAAMAGVVRHLAPTPSSGYGRYIVIEHPEQTPAVYTLYGHLARIAPGLAEGATVTRGQPIGTLGHSSGGYMIPADRAHLHFEIGLMVTRDFPAWYARHQSGTRNDHGAWNGKNLMGIDALEFFNLWRARRVNTLQDYFSKMETAVRVRVAASRTPDFVTRYPSLLTKPLPLGLVAGWEIRFNWTGLPFAWTPLTGLEAVGLSPGAPQFVEVNSDLLRRERSRSLAVQRRGGWVAGKDLEPVLQQLFNR
ncbi:MAG: hypothetical protein RLZZ15_2348 [Verrucomicrobiota bacterium]|jgi:murein DD-endopeptidase MepM/ murein hydrolase activator NlpD